MACCNMGIWTMWRGDVIFFAISEGMSVGFGPGLSV